MPKVANSLARLWFTNCWYQGSKGAGGLCERPGAVGITGSLAKAVEGTGYQRSNRQKPDPSLRNWSDGRK